MVNKLPTFAGAGGGGSSGGHIAANSLFSNATLKVLDLISEGEIGGLVDGLKSIYFDDVPLMNQTGTTNFDGVSASWVNGRPDQEVLEGFGEVSQPIQVGQEVKHNLPVTKAIDVATADKIRVVVSLPSLFSQDSDGDINETSVSFRFEISTENYGNFKSLGEFTISGKQNSQYERSYTFNLPNLDDGRRPSYWLLRMTRLSGDSTERYSARTIFDTIFAISESQLNYPYSAIVGVKVNAESLQSVPTRSYLVDGLYIQVPSNYDGANYHGVWDGTFKLMVSSNPAWILYALLTNKRWGLGQFIKPEQVNKAKLYEIGRYCDELVDDGYGNKEKRFTINTQIAQRSDAYRLLCDISAVFRGMTYWAGGMAGFTCDKPTDPTMLYTASNVIDGIFTYAGSSRQDRHSIALVTWNDPEQNYKQVVEYVEDAELIAKYGVRQAELTAFGCTSRAQAIRAGKWILYTENYESETITFSVGLDSALVLPGDVIQIQDPSYAGKRMGGRLVSCSKIRAELDAGVTLDPNESATIAIRMPNGLFVERDIKVMSVANNRFIEWNDPLEEEPAPNAIWMISVENLKPITARVVNIKQGQKPNTFEITAIKHQPKKYDLIEKGIKFEEDNTTSNDPLDVGAPSNPNVEEEARSLGLGYISSVLNITWRGGRNVASYELQWRREDKNETDWVTITTKNKGIQLEDVQQGTYHFILRGVGILGNKSAQIEFYYVASGQYVTPLDVTDFSVIKRPSYLEVRWKPVELATAYEVRCGSAWDNAEVLTTNFSGTSFVHYQYEAGDYYYHIRSISNTGEYSPNTTTYKLELRAPKMPEELAAVVFQNRIDFTWKSNTEDDLSHYELREGVSWEAGIKVAESKVNQMSVPGGFQQNRKFWLKAIALPKIYSEDAAWVEIGIPTDNTRNLIISHNARASEWPSNMVYMTRRGDDVEMTDGAKHSEYIHEMVLADRITAQNSFYTSVSPVVQASDDNETWESATFPWDSTKALRSWRLGGDGESIGYKNEISRRIGFVYNEIEGFSLANTLDSENGKKPAEEVNVAYDWGRYRQGLIVNKNTKVSWNDPSLVSTNDGKYKFCFWFKTSDMQANRTYQLIRFGNQENALVVTYNTEDHVYRLIADNGDTIESEPIEVAVVDGDHIFVGISQTETTRTFVVGLLGGQVNLKSAEQEPIGKIEYIRLGGSGFN